MSLLAMCLRKVPEYMAELEQWEQKDAEANGTKSMIKGSDVSFEIYSELESLGTVDGWKHLCIVVRAHSVRVVEEAVHEGLLDDSITGLLIRLCLEYMSLTECEGLVQTFISRAYPSPARVDESLYDTPAMRPLRILKTCDSIKPYSLAGWLAHLLSGGLLPADWILTADMAKVWTPRMLTNALSGKRKTPGHEAAGFIAATIEHLCRMVSSNQQIQGTGEGIRDRDKAQKLLTEQLAAITAMALLSQAASGAGLATEVQYIAETNKRAGVIIQAAASNLKGRRRGAQPDLGVYLLALCSVILFRSGDSYLSTVIAAWRNSQAYEGSEELVRQYDATLALVGGIAHQYSRGTHSPPNECLAQLCDKLSALGIPNLPLDNMRVDGAFFLAEQTGNLRDLAFAENLKATRAMEGDPGLQTMAQGAKADSLSAKKVSFSGFRWDDDIGEWVIASSVSASAVPGPMPRRPTTRTSSSVNTAKDPPVAMRPRVSRPRAQRIPVEDEAQAPLSDSSSTHSSELDDNGDDDDGGDDSDDYTTDLSDTETTISEASCTSPPTTSTSSGVPRRILTRTRSRSLLLSANSSRSSSPGRRPISRARGGVKPEGTQRQQLHANRRASYPMTKGSDTSEESDDDDDELASDSRSSRDNQRMKVAKRVRRSGRAVGGGERTRSVVPRGSLLSLVPKRRSSAFAGENGEGGDISSDDELSFL